jgi:hypothetical protein
MVEKFITSPDPAPGNAQRLRNVVDLSFYRERNGLARALPMSPRTCRHCGAVLADGEREEECSSTFNVDAARLRWQAAQILRGIM